MVFFDFGELRNGRLEVGGWEVDRVMGGMMDGVV